MTTQQVYTSPMIIKVFADGCYAEPGDLNWDRQGAHKMVITTASTAEELDRVAQAVAAGVNSNIYEFVGWQTLSEEGE